MRRPNLGAGWLVILAFAGHSVWAQESAREEGAPPSSQAQQAGLTSEPGGRHRQGGGEFFEQAREEPRLAPEAGNRLIVRNLISGYSRAQGSSQNGRTLRGIAFSGSWRFRTEAWGWFAPRAGDRRYAFAHSLLRAAIGQSKAKYDWLLEGAQDGIVGLPAGASAPGEASWLGFGGIYFAANGNRRNAASAFLKQGYVRLVLPRDSNLTLGRFNFSDGAEMSSPDPTVSEAVNTRISQRLIGGFDFSAVMRSFDGLRFSHSTETTNVTFFAARPTEGVFHLQAMRELNIDLLYAAYSVETHSSHSDGLFRIFALGYLDQRKNAAKTDNRAAGARNADSGAIRLGTYGISWAHVIRNYPGGALNIILWGAVQSGRWGAQDQHSGAFAGEVGWQPVIRDLNPWFSAGFSYGSGDANPGDGRHGTFFQVLPAVRQYARFPFYNMQNNQDTYLSAVLRPAASLLIRSELHSLRLANREDLWYSGGGAFLPGTFGYTGRASGGDRDLATVWDLSFDFPLRYRFRGTAYYAHAWGEKIIANIYPGGANAQMFYLETNFRF